AIVHQNKIGDVNGQLPARIERMRRLDGGVETHFLRGGDFRLSSAHLLALGDEYREFWIFRRYGLCKWMVGRQRHELGAKQRVWPRRENLKLAFLVRGRSRIQHEADDKAFRSADPVLLH